MIRSVTGREVAANPRSSWRINLGDAYAIVKGGEMIHIDIEKLGRHAQNAIGLEVAPGLGRHVVQRENSADAGENRARGSKAVKPFPQRSQEASSTIHFTSPPNDMPAYAAISGTRDVSVMPGCVLTSRTTSSPSPSGLSS